MADSSPDKFEGTPLGVSANVRVPFLQASKTINVTVLHAGSGAHPKKKNSIIAAADLMGLAAEHCWHLSLF